MSYQNLILEGSKPYQNPDIHDLRVRGDLTCDGDLILSGSILPETGEELRLHLPIASNLDDEYVSFQGAFTNVVGVTQEMVFSLGHQGHIPYVPDTFTNANTAIFTESGIYNITFNILPVSGGFVTTDVVHFIFWDSSDADTRWLECIQIGSGAPGGSAGFTLSGIYYKPDNAAKNFKFYATRTSGASSVDFDVKCIITRIK